MGGTAVLGNMVMRLTAETKDFQQGLADSKAQSQTFTAEIEDNRLSLTDLKSGLDMARQGLEMVGQAFDATAGFAIDYGMQVKDTSALLGVNATEASTLIQVLEDLRVESSSLEMASKKLKDQGLVPNIETLIQLSAEYQKLGTPVERNTFLFDKFGRAGIDLQKVMEAGPETLREYAAAAAASGKVVDEQFVQEMEDARLILDDFSDQVDATKIKVGVWLVSGIVEARNAGEELNKAMERGVLTTEEYGEIMGQLRRNEIEYADVQEIVNQKIDQANVLEEARIRHLELEYSAEMAVTGAVWGNAMAMDYAARAALGLDEAYATIGRGNLVGAIGEVAGAWDEAKARMDLYKDGLDLLSDSMMEQQYWANLLAFTTGTITEAEYLANLETWTSVKAYDTLNQALEDGIISKGDWLAAMADGIVTQEEVNELLGTQKDELWEAEQAAAGLYFNLAALDGVDVSANVTVNYEATGSGSGGTGGATIIFQLAKGGAFWADSPTVMMVGEGGESEYVQVTPKSKMGTEEGAGGGGDTYNVVINDRMAARLWLDQQRTRREERIEGLM